MPASAHQERSTQYCPQCKTPARDGATFCNMCGQELSNFRNGVSQVLASNDLEKSPPHCPRCEIPVRNTAKFCHACGQKLPNLKNGDHVGNYIIERLLGVGGIGTVYLSHHQLLKHQVALKIHDYFSYDKDVARTFLQASNYLAQMDHPHIIHLYEYGFQGESAYQAVEYIDGPTLAHLLPPQQTKSWVDRCIEYFAQILFALHYAHTCRYTDMDGMSQQGILHGDIKPQNIFLDAKTDTIKLTDFMLPDVQAFLGAKGIAFQEMIETTQIFGTPGYMAPEQKKGQITPQTDIYSLGVTMYQLLTEERTQSRRNGLRLHNDIPPIYENPHIPPWLNNVIVQAMRRDSSQRFQTVAQMIQIFQNHREYASTNLTKHIGVYQRSYNNNQIELRDALEEFREAILASNEVSLRKKQEITEIIRQISEEFMKVEPNITLLRMISNGFMEMVGTLPTIPLSNIARVIANLSANLDKEQRNMNKTTRILFLSANPKDTPSLRLDEEIRSIELSLRQAKFREVFEMKHHWALRATDLQGYLLHYQPDIVHFSGHGSESGKIMLEDNSGKSRSVSPRALSQVFSILKDNVRCVVLNACYSEQQAEAIAQHIDCVVGMSQAIGDDAAISFAMAFYQALGFGRNVKTAFELGCAQIDLESLDEQDTPKLLAINSDPTNIYFAVIKH